MNDDDVDIDFLDDENSLEDTNEFGSGHRQRLNLDAKRKVEIYLEEKELKRQLNSLDDDWF